MSSVLDTPVFYTTSAPDPQTGLVRVTETEQNKQNIAAKDAENPDLPPIRGFVDSETNAPIQVQAPSDPIASVAYTGSGDDTIEGGFIADTLGGGAGNDFIEGNKGADLIYGDAGNDTLFGDSESATSTDIVKDKGDTIFGGLGDDLIYGGVGNDLLYGQQGNDTIYGGVDNDTIYGGDGNDSLLGEAGNDVLYGGNGNDTISGGEGNDSIFGGAGEDIISGGAGVDTLKGSAGDDTFVFSQDNAGEVDKILDFTSGEDKIGLTGFGSITSNDVTYNQNSGILSVNGQQVADLGAGTVFDKDNDWEII